MFTLRVVFLFFFWSATILAGNIEPYPVPLEVSALSQSDGKLMGRLLIPSIAVNEIIRTGIDLSVIDKGVAYWVGSAKPGHLGNLVLAGHRTTKTAPFYEVAKLKQNDEIIIISLDGTVSKYLVDDTFVVDPIEGVWIVDPPKVNGESILTIFTCHPMHSKKERYVVRARLVQ